MEPIDRIRELLSSDLLFGASRAFPSLRLSLFVLSAKGKGRVPPQLVYGCCHPDIHPASSRVAVAYLLKSIATQGKPKRGLARVDVRLPPGPDIICELLRAQSLAAFLQSQGFPSDDRLKKIGQLSFSHGQPDGILYTTPRDYLYRHLSPTPASHSIYEKHSGFSLVIRTAQRVGNQYESIPQKATDKVSQETRIDFSNSIEQSRLGAIEYMSFPNLAPDLQKNIYLEDSDGQLCLKVHPNFALSGLDIALIRMESRPGVYTHVELDLDGFHHRQTTLMPDSQTLGAADLFIFARIERNVRQLVFQDHIAYIRSVGFTGKVITQTSHVHIDQIPRSVRRDHSRSVEYLESRADGLSTSPNVDVHPHTPLLPEMGVPNSSGCFFFDTGWGQKDSGSPRLSFWQWLQKTVSSSRRLNIQDPYFDRLGIQIIEATADTGMVFVHTCLEAASDDDSEQERRRERVLRTCRQLGARSITIYDYPTNSLHDRFVWSTDLTASYHLSNSIQNAATRHPLVVTPIPDQGVTRKISTHLDNLRPSATQVWPLPVTQPLADNAESRFYTECLDENLLSPDQKSRSNYNNPESKDAVWAKFRRCITERWPHDDFWGATQVVSHIATRDLVSFFDPIEADEIRYLVDRIVEFDRTRTGSLVPIPLQTIDNIRTFDMYHMSLSRWSRPAQRNMSAGETIVLNILSQSMCTILYAVAHLESEQARATFSAVLLDMHFDQLRSTNVELPTGYSNALVRLWNPVLGCFGLAYAAAREDLTTLLRCIEGVDSPALRLHVLSGSISTRGDLPDDHNELRSLFIGHIASALSETFANHDPLPKRATETLKSSPYLAEALCLLKDEKDTSHSIFKTLTDPFSNLRTHEPSYRVERYFSPETRRVLADSMNTIGEAAHDHISALLGRNVRLAVDINRHLGNFVAWRRAWTSALLLCDIASLSMPQASGEMAVRTSQKLQDALSQMSKYPSRPPLSELDSLFLDLCTKHLHL